MQASQKSVIINKQETPAFAGVTCIDLLFVYFAELSIINKLRKKWIRL